MLYQTDSPTKVSLLAVAKAVKRAKRLILISGVRADADLVGLLVAFFHYCSHFEKNISCFNTENVPNNLQFLDLPNFIYSSDKLDPQTDVVVTFDIGELKETGLTEWINKYKPTVINIDHHQTNCYFGHLNIVNTKAASTTELIYNLFKLTNTPINKKTATAMLAGLMTDTGNLSNPATSSTAMAMAGDLIKTGGQFKTVINNTLKNKTLGMLKLWGKAIHRLKHNKELGIATVVISHKDIIDIKEDAESLQGLPNFLTVLSDARAILVLREYEPGMIKGSLRTIHGNIDVGLLATNLGGGGHQKAAGFVLEGALAKKENGWYIS